MIISSHTKWNKAFLKTEADALIFSAYIRNWQLLAVNATTGILGAFLEGGTLGIVFLAITLLTHTDQIDWSQYGIFSTLPELSGWLNVLDKEIFFLGLLLFAVIAQILASLSKYLNTLSLGYLAAALRVQITSEIHQQVMKFSFAHASRYKVGDLIDYIVAASSTVKSQIEQSNNLIVSSFLLLTYLSVMVLISPWLLVAAVVMASLLYLIQKRLLPSIRSTAAANQTHQVEFAKQVVEHMQGLRFLHTYAYQQSTNRKTEQALQQLLPGLKQQVRLLSLLEPITQSLPTIMLALLTGTAFLIFQNNSSGVLPSLATFVIALQRFNVRLQGIATARNLLADNSGRMQRLREVLRPAGKEFARCGGQVFPGLYTDIELHDVTLCYQPNQPRVLKQIQLVIPKGKVTAFVGESGAGKSSLADLLIGLYEPSEGSIRVNDRDLKEFDPTSWRECLGVVSQDTFIFNESILENIRLGRAAASDDEVLAAARAAQAHHFIQALSEGYSTVVGERGYRLSGGQRQRLALARAILRNPELLILDEATSALDTQSERLVQQALEKFGQDRTVVVIAHRLSTIVEADQIVVLQQGKIVEQGTHEMLIKLNGAYAHYWQLQSRTELLTTSY